MRLQKIYVLINWRKYRKILTIHKSDPTDNRHKNGLAVSWLSTIFPIKIQYIKQKIILKAKLRFWYRSKITFDITDENKITKQSYVCISQVCNKFPVINININVKKVQQSWWTETRNLCTTTLAQQHFWHLFWIAAARISQARNHSWRQTNTVKVVKKMTKK